MNLTRISVATALMAATATAAAMAPAHADSDAAADKSPFHVSLQASAKTATAGEDVVKLKGKVSPAKPGDKVVLQALYEDRKNWKTLRTVKLAKNSTFKFTDKPTTANNRAYRVVKAADKTHAKGISTERAVQVSAWQWLNSRTPSAAEGVVGIYSLPINGEEFRQSLYADRAAATAFTEYTLGRRCSQLEATFGLSDRTETGGEANISVTADGKSLYSRAFPLGVSDSQTLSVENVYRVRIDFAQLNGTPATEAAAGSARVLCD